VVAVSAPTPRPGPLPNRPDPPAGNPPGNPPAGNPAGHPAGADSAASTVAAVQASVTDLDQLDDLPVADHVARYDALHGTLSEALAAIDGV
jgi:hypothetical protein